MPLLAKADPNRWRRVRWNRTVVRAWCADAETPLTERLLRVESQDRSVISSGKFTGSPGYPEDHWRCIAAAPAVRWMRGLRWEDVRAHLGRSGFSWQWL